MRPTFDEQDAAIRDSRQQEFNQLDGPRVGDYLRTAEGLLRFTHDWGEDIQTTVRPTHPCNGDSSFYLSSDGHVSFSGSLDRAIPKTRLVDTKTTMPGGFWFFHHNWAEADNGVACEIDCRVYTLII